jgi:small subunit ribosomal protein S16
MVLKIRLQRFGCKHRPHYRVVVAESAKRRDGSFVEALGSYDPVQPNDKKVHLNLSRADYWMSVGAQPTDTVQYLVNLARQNTGAQQND